MGDLLMVNTDDQVDAVMSSWYKAITSGEIDVLVRQKFLA
jgi:hypothetical protein